MVSFPFPKTFLNSPYTRGSPITVPLMSLGRSWIICHWPASTKNEKKEKKTNRIKGKNKNKICTGFKRSLICNIICFHCPAFSLVIQIHLLWEYCRTLTKCSPFHHQYYHYCYYYYQPIFCWRWNGYSAKKLIKFTFKI